MLPVVAARRAAGACEIFRGAAESPTLERLDLSQNRISDDVPEWPHDLVLRNRCMQEVDMSFNWVQVGP